MKFILTCLRGHVTPNLRPWPDPKGAGFHHVAIGSLKGSTEEKDMFQYSLAWHTILTKPAACWP